MPGDASSHGPVWIHWPPPAWRSAQASLTIGESVIGLSSPQSPWGSRACHTKNEHRDQRREEEIAQGDQAEP
jgi:hypothetical protein